MREGNTSYVLQGSERIRLEGESLLNLCIDYAASVTNGFFFKLKLIHTYTWHRAWHRASEANLVYVVVEARIKIRKVET